MYLKIKKTNLKKKKIEKKNWKHFFFGFLLLFLKVWKVQRPGRKTSGFRTVRILKNFQISGPDVMSGRALQLPPGAWTILYLFLFTLSNSTMRLRIVNFSSIDIYPVKHFLKYWFIIPVQKILQILKPSHNIDPFPQ